MIPDRPLLGILLMLGFCIMAPLGDALAKVLGQTVPLGILLLARFAIQALLLLPIIAVTGRTWRLTGKILYLAWLRAALHIIGIGAMFTALVYLPLADAVAIAFVMPFIMLILGHYVLGEEIGMRRIIACAVGFIGTLLVIQPAFENAGWPALLPLVVAVVFSLFMLVTRLIAKNIDPISLQGVNGVMAVIILTPLVFLFRDSGIALFEVKMPNGQEWLLLLAIGTLGTVAHLFMTWSLRFAPSATLAPMQYLEIPFATFVGWFVFQELPNGLAAIGILITITAGLYIVMRERAMNQPAPSVP
ncbi:DMT family transporter [Planktotalea sp.]|uniref:DMT family transporter n=1 Tax=Planktotalea sp. TaxID=2029877 RepID=UPI0032969BC2